MIQGSVMELTMEPGLLDKGCVDHVMALQTSCLAVLPDDQDLIHKKTPDDFQRILTSRHMEMIGIWEGGDLIAQAVALFPDIQHPDADMQDMVLPGPVESVTTLAGVIVHPEHKGKRLMGQLIDAWHDLAADRGREHALAMITDRNVPSLAGFLSGGLRVVDVAIDKDDNSTVYYAHGQLNGNSVCRPSFKNATIPTLVTPGTCYYQRKELFEAGYVGTRLLKTDEGVRTSTLELHQHEM